MTLIGANGAGKTTTLKTISGLLHPRRGTRQVFEGKDISQTAAHHLVRDGIGHAPEGRRIFSRMTVLENLLMGAFTRDQTTDPAGHRSGHGPVPAAPRTDAPAWRHAVRRRAADAGDRTGAHVRAAGAPARRAVAGPLRRSSSSRSSRRSRRSTSRAPRCCSSSRTRCRRSRSRIARTSSRPGGSCSPGPRRTSRQNESVRKAYLGED